MKRVSEDTRTTVLRDLEPGRDYKVSVAARNSAGAGSATVVPVRIHDVPSAPTGLTATRLVGGLSVSWMPPDSDGGLPVTGYILQWKRVADGRYGSSVSLDDEVTNRDLEGLDAATEYNVRVAAVNALGTGAGSQATQRVPGLPGPVKNLSVRSEYGGWKVTWGTPSHDGWLLLTGYRVRWKKASELDYTEQVEVGDETTAATVTSLDAGPYDIVVVALNPVGAGTERSLQGTALDYVVPSEPTALNLDVGTDQMTVSWSPPEDEGGKPVTGYEVRWRPAGESDFAETQELVASANTFVIEDVTTGDLDFIGVRASNSVGSGSEAAVTTPGPPPAGVVVGVDSMLVLWRPPDDGGVDVSGYRLRHKATTAQSYEAPQQLGPETLRLALSGLDEGGSYDLALSAVNALGEGAWSSHTVELDSSGLPTAPQDLVVDAGAAGGSVSWSLPYSDGGSQIVKYRVRWAGGADGVAEVTDLNDLRHELPGLAYGIYHVVSVWAVNANGTGQPAAAAVSPAFPTPPPANLKLVVKDGALEISWQYRGSGFSPFLSNERVAEYRVQWRASNQDYSVERQAVLEGTGPTTRVNDWQDFSYLIPGLENGVEYWIRVVGVNGAGEGFPVEMSGVPLAPAVGGPRDLKIAPGNRALSVGWARPPQGETWPAGFRVQWRLDGEDYDAVRSADVTGTSYKIVDLDPGQQYRVRVASLDSSSPTLAAAESRGVPTAKLNKPNDLTVSPGDSSMVASWSPPDPISGAPVIAYRVAWSGTLSHEVYTADLSVEAIGLHNGKPFAVYVAATNTLGLSDAAHRDSVTTSVPSEVMRLRAVPLPGGLQLSWVRPPSIPTGLSYRSQTVQWKGPGQEYNATDRQDTTILEQYSITGLTDGTEYSVRVAVTNALGAGPSVELSGTAGDDPQSPLATRGVRLTPGDGTLLVTWNPVVAPSDSTLDGYRVQWRGEGESYSADRQAAVEPTRYEITGLTNGASYEVRVMAVIDGRPGPATVAVRTPATRPGPPVDAVVVTGDRTLILAWAPPDDDGGSAVTGYAVAVAAAGEDLPADKCSARWIEIPRPAIGIGSPPADESAIALTNHVEYTVRIAARNSKGLGPPVYLTATPFADEDG